MISIAKEPLRIVLRLFRTMLCMVAPLPYRVVVVTGRLTQSEIQDLMPRFRMFYPDENLPPMRNRLFLVDVVYGVSVLALDGQSISSFVRKLNKSKIFFVNPNEEPEEAWNWYRFLQSYHGLPDTNRRAQSYAKLRERVGELKKLGLEKVYLLGTGKSLGNADKVDFSDGYRVVCNTIVKDAELWRHVNPHFIVAGDAIYHFGPDDYAREFRRDLHKRLSESDTFFVYPELFDVLVKRELSDFDEKLIPIPQGIHMEICCDLVRRFELPGMGNVLNNSLLPLGCTLSDNIYLWGFDGRAPDDKLFWANSSKHSYGEHFEALVAANPAFFNHHVPKTDPGKYARTIHGDYLDECLSRAEQSGKKFIMMHFSWTQTLNKRFKPTDMV